jgi:hypothetical protein
LVSISYKQARRIKRDERDRALPLGDLAWSGSPPASGRWEPAEHGVQRLIRHGDGDSRLPCDIAETMLRFPSAPVHGLQRLNEHHVKLGPSENFHTYRILQAASPEQRHPLQRIFLMHTGLNELDNFGLYYELAGHLISREPATTVIVRPFPGHLTRYPFQGFAETPLDRYLWDGSQLFRQFLRYMIETQWLLSALARRTSYRCASGANLLAEGESAAVSRLDTAYLASCMREAWARMHAHSVAAMDAAQRDQQQAPQVNPVVPPDSFFVDAISSLRALLNLESDYPGTTGELGSNEPEPAVHVLGYSLGGFTAQSVFMSWPFLVASCITLLAGGPLHELAPTEFAHPEEWQTVLHTLRYELDDRLLALAADGPVLAPKSDSGSATVAGIDLELFTYLKRTFYEVFEQAYRGSAQTRLIAFRRRMLFVVGGNDPVVQPRSVIDSAPPGGVNLLEVGALGHFLGKEPSGYEERHQRTFWLPEIAALIHRFADTAAQMHTNERPLTWFDMEMSEPLLPRGQWEAAFHGVPPAEDDRRQRRASDRVARLAATELSAMDGDGSLSQPLFERCLDDLLARIARRDAPTRQGIVFILRNEIPAMLQHPSTIRETAAALYHDDVGIVRYAHGVATRRDVVSECIDRVCLILPANAARMMHQLDALPGYPSQSESAGSHVPTRLTAAERWAYCVKTLNALSQGPGRHSVRVFDGHTPVPGSRASDRMHQLLGRARGETGNEEVNVVAGLPDCWVWMSREFLCLPEQTRLTAETAIEELPRAVVLHTQDREALLEQLRHDQVRLIGVSHARFNPRFRGRLVVDPRIARRLLVHVAICVAMSEPLGLHGPAAAFASA